MSLIQRSVTPVVKSETILGKLIADSRDDLVLMTKCAHPGNSAPENLQSQFDTSRQRLNQEVIDVLFLHRWDNVTPLEHTFEYLAGLKQAGSIRSIGVSNFSAWQVMKAQAVATRFNISIDVLQPMYNLVKRQAEVELFPMALSEGFAVTPYSPLGGGLLTGKYLQAADGRLKQDEKYAARYDDEAARETARDPGSTC